MSKLVAKRPGSEKPRLRTHKEDESTWVATVNGRTMGRSTDRDAALFWAGYWYGRKALGRVVQHCVRGGARTDEDFLPDPDDGAT